MSLVTLNKNADRRLRQGHVWVYSNEINTELSPLKSFSPGEPVDVVNSQGKWMGSGYINPHSLISVRLLSRNPDFPLSASLLVHRLNIALALRERFYAHPYYRLVFGESDGLPGLLVDRYGDYLVVVITTAGMESLKNEILEALQKVIRPQGILLRNDSSVRKMEGLDQYIEVGTGQIPETVFLQEGGCRFETSLFEGQKTGWFFDQAANRDRMLKYVDGARVLDVCSYIGAWSVRAAKAGAQSVLSVDISESALQQLHANAQLNGVENQVESFQQDAFAALRELKQQSEKFDVVILDPPAFMKRRKDIKKGQIAYRRLNELALQLLNNEGILITASCSYHMAADALLNLVQQSARHNDRLVQLLEQGQQGIDHPVHPAIAETSYLKAFYARVLKNS